MIYHQGDKPLAGKYRFRPNGKWWSVTEIYKGANLVWTAIKSCFGKGFWINEKPWLNDDAWKNNA